jgi:hypothetical protein
MSPESNIRYFISVTFAVMVVLLGFYALVIYPYTLDPLIVGFFVSIMTLAVQYVFGEQLASGTARRMRQSYEQGSTASGGPTVTASGAESVVVEPTTSSTTTTTETSTTGTRG